MLNDWQLSAVLLPSSIYFGPTGCLCGNLLVGGGSRWEQVRCDLAAGQPFSLATCVQSRRVTARRVSGVHAEGPGSERPPASGAPTVPNLCTPTPSCAGSGGCGKAVQCLLVKK